jgi:hypothetical protein
MVVRFDCEGAGEVVFKLGACNSCNGGIMVVRFDCGGDEVDALEVSTDVSNVNQNNTAKSMTEAIFCRRFFLYFLIFLGMDYFTTANY